MICFLDTEFTSLHDPHLLSIGLVTLDGHEHYVELDMDSSVGQRRLKASSDFVRFVGVLDLWGLVPGANSSHLQMGQRTGEWVLRLAEESGTRVEVAFDYATDFELMEAAIRDAGLWEQVRDLVTPVNVGQLTDSPDAETAAEACFHQLSGRGLARHHALADALALRAAYIAVDAGALRKGACQ